MTWPSLSSAKLWCVLTLVAVLMLWLSPPAHCQNILNVPADYPTIQSAINAASNGDTVLVTPGTYVENINFSGKGITLTSSNGAAATIIDGNHNGSVVTFNHSETPTSVLTGFTIRNGYLDGGEGAGIHIWAASPTITNNVITGNHAADGIGIYVNGGAPLIKSNTITANDQEDAGDGGGGGGILVAGSDNTPASPQIISNTITNNSVANGGDGGGIAVQYYASPLIQGNLIRGNIAFNSGGGISLQTYALAVVSDNLIVNNRSLGAGSGAGIWISAAGLAQTTVSNIVNNTIVGNTAFDSTSGIYSTGYGQYVKISNNIVVASAGQTGVTCSLLFSQILPALSHNDVHSDTVGWSGCGTPTNGGAGNIDLNPLFIDPSTNFHLQSGSPVLDAGDNSAPGLPSTDFDGSPRVVDGNADGIAVVDMGAYELQPTTITWTPDSLTFNPQPLRTTSPPQTLTLTTLVHRLSTWSLPLAALSPKPKIAPEQCPLGLLVPSVSLSLRPALEF
jgi:Right handed beta helix region